MALDGIVIANIRQELEQTLLGGRLYKIAQPETDELLFTIKTPKQQYRLVISANASLPLIYLSAENKPSPMTAPNFCMLLRKHLNNGRIISITQPGLERILDFEIEHLNDLGDLCRKHLIAEFMGKHSNIIFCDDKQNILDSIKHISSQTSSVREVLPGRTYFIPQTMKRIRCRQTMPNLQKLFLQSRCRFQRRFTPAIPVSVLPLQRKSAMKLLFQAKNRQTVWRKMNSFTYTTFFRTAWNR